MLPMSPEQMEAYANLNDAEQRFATTLLGGGTPVEALNAGGWVGANKTRATAIRNRPHVRKFMALMQVDLVADAMMSRNEAIERLSEIARSSITDVVDVKTVNWGTEQQPDIQTTWQLKSDGESLSSVSKISSGPAGPRVELYSALAAIKQLSDMCGWEVPKQSEVKVSTDDDKVIDVTKLSNETLHELVLNHYATSDNE